MPIRDNPKNKDKQLVRRLFIESLIALFLAETLVMLALQALVEPLHLPPLLEGFIDSATLGVLFLPILYLTFFRPISMEINRRVVSETMRQQSESRYAAVISAAMDGFCAVDIRGKFLEVNEAYCRMSGYNPQELLRMSIKDVEAVETIGDVARHIHKIMEAGYDRFETRHRRKDGTIIDIEVSTNYLPQEKGKLFVFLHDITERKRKEDELRKLNELNKTLVQTIPFSMHIVDTEGNIVFIGPKTKSVFGEGILGRKCWEVYRDDKKQCDACPLKNHIAIGQTAAVEVDGVLGGKFFQIHHTGLEYEGKKAILEIFQDITELKRYENELIMANKELVKLDRLKNEFIASVSHELRTPMGIIREGVSQVREGMHGEVNQGQRYYLEKSLSQLDRLTKITNSILEVSLIEAGKIGLQFEAVDVISLAKETCSSFETIARNKGLTIRPNFSDTQLVLQADKDRLKQVFSNLIENAIKFTEKGYVEIAIENKADTVECCVSDTGQGMKTEALPKAFDKFEQFGRVYGPGEKGVGLGLSIAKGIIELHKGKIWIESEPGKGTRVSFSLPKGTS